MRRQKILIISMSAGSGHVMAAKSILDYALSNLSNVSIEHFDFSKLASPFDRFINQHIYEFVSKKIPNVWGFYYQATNYSKFLLFISSKLVKIQSFFQQRIVKFLLEKNPDIIIFTNPIPACLMVEKIKKKSNKKIKTAIVVTDYSAHSIYNIPNIDYYFVGCGEVKYDLIKMGIGEDKIFISGIPVNPRFYIEQDVAEIKQKYKLNQNLPTFLFITSGLSRHIVEFVLKIFEKFKDNANIIIITGGNKKLYDYIREKFKKDNFLVVDWTNVIDEYMKASEVILGKPGGLVSSECMSIGKKLFIVGFIPGVERYNARYMERNDFAEIIKNKKDLFKKLSEIVCSGEIDSFKNYIYKENPAKIILETLLDS